MSQVINTNALSLVAQNNLNKSQSTLGTAIQRLSSGLRINSAKDDAAGQAISNRFTASISGLTQASRNANDGISIAQTTEGALNEVNDNLQNIRRLTVQAQNGTNSDSDRQSIQDEIDARLSEINRISDQTEFNGVKVLSQDQSLSIQVGSNDSETIDINLTKMDADTLGMTDFSVANGVNVATLNTTTNVDVDEGYKYDAAAVKDTGAAVKADDIVKDDATGKIYAQVG
ncbi:flagellin FliC, partial [Escherichia coli]|nr:flagellin FliC [Escherichia coli]